MGLFNSFNPFDPAGIFSGGGGGGSSSSGGASGIGLSVGGGPSEETQDKANEFDAKKAYGFTSPTDSTFNAMRKQQMGMGGSSQGG